MSSSKGPFLELVCPLIGVLLANLMFLAPWPELRRARSTQSAENVSLLVLVCIVGNCAGWIAYSFTQSNLFVYFANAPGCCLGLYYFLTAFPLVKKEQRVVPQRLLLFFLALQITLGILAVELLKTRDERQFLYGISTNLILAAYYAAPLSAMHDVIAKKNSSLLNPLLAFCNTLNGSFWTAYGFALGDFFIWVPNLLGAVLGCVQLALCRLYPRSPSPATTTTATPAPIPGARSDRKNLQKTSGMPLMTMNMVNSSHNHTAPSSARPQNPRVEARNTTTTNSAV